MKAGLVAARDLTDVARETALMQENSAKVGMRNPIIAITIILTHPINPHPLGVHSNQQATGVKPADWEFPAYACRPQSLRREACYHSHVHPRQGDTFTKWMKKL